MEERLLIQIEVYKRILTKILHWVNLLVDWGDMDILWNCLKSGNWGGESQESSGLKLEVSNRHLVA